MRTAAAALVCVLGVVAAAAADEAPLPEVAAALDRIKGASTVELATTGRKTGKEHKVALPMWRDPKGQPIVVGSFAGAPGHPSWFINLRDRAANPEVLCRVQGRQYWSVPDILEGDEYRRIWDLLTADRAWYNDYQAKAPRRIPLVRLRETRPA